MIFLVGARLWEFWTVRIFGTSCSPASFRLVRQIRTVRVEKFQLWEKKSSSCSNSNCANFHLAIAGIKNQLNLLYWEFPLSNCWLKKSIKSTLLKNKHKDCIHIHPHNGTIAYPIVLVVDEEMRPSMCCEAARESRIDGHVSRFHDRRSWTSNLK